MDIAGYRVANRTAGLKYPLRQTSTCREVRIESGSKKRRPLNLVLAVFVQIGRSLHPALPQFTKKCGGMIRYRGGVRKQVG